MYRLYIGNGPSGCFKAERRAGADCGEHGDRSGRGRGQGGVVQPLCWGNASGDGRFGVLLAGDAHCGGCFCVDCAYMFPDTRNSAAVDSDETVSFQVAGAYDIPAGASAVVMT